MWLNWWILLETFKKKMPVSYKCFQRTKEGGQFQISITLISKSGKDITEKENFKPKSLMNIDLNILNRILAN